MSDFVGDRECVTHHACDCIQAERARYRRALLKVKLDAGRLPESTGRRLILHTVQEALTDGS